MAYRLIERPVSVTLPGPNCTDACCGSPSRKSATSYGPRAPVPPERIETGEDKGAVRVGLGVAAALVVAEVAAQLQVVATATACRQV